MSDKSVEIVIGAKDQASAILRNVAAETKRVGDGVKKMGRDANNAGGIFSRSIAGMLTQMKTLAAGYIAFSTVRSAITFLSESAAAADEAAEAERALAKAIELTGSTIGPTIEQHKQLAASLQTLIGFEGDAAVALMKQASMLGINNENIQNAIKLSIGLSEALGIDANTALQKVALAIHGNASAFAKLIPGLKNAQTEEQKLAMIQLLAAKGLEQKEDRASTSLGMAERLSNAWGDFKESIGALLGPLRQLSYGMLVPLIEIINTSLIPAVERMTLPINAVKIALNQLRFTVASMFTSVDVAVNNVGNLWDLMSYKFTLALVQMREDATHTLVTVIPAYVEWFSDNFFNLISDSINLVKVEFVNFATSVGEIMDGLWDVLISGGEDNAIKLANAISRAMQRGLTEGFKAQTTPLPNIAERQVTDLEKRLQAGIARIVGLLAGDFATKMAERLKGIMGDIGVDPIVQEEKGKDAKNRRDEFIRSIDAKQSRLLTRGPARDIQSDILTESKKQTKKLERIEKNTYPEPRSLTKALELTKVGL